MPAEQVIGGEVASPGLAFGSIALHVVSTGAPAAKGTPEEERQALETALGTASAQLAGLIDGVEETAGDILSFQVALIEDPELTSPAFEEIAGGAAAVEAWGRALGEQIAIYGADESDTFRARATDLADLRDRVAGILLGEGEAAGSADRPVIHGAIYVGRDLAPSRFLETDWSRYSGAALIAGSASSHLAMLARARGVPLLIGLDAAEEVLRDGAKAILDAENGRLILDPRAPTLARYRARAARRGAEAKAEATYLDGPAVTADGERIQVCVNLDGPGAIEGLDPSHCDGVGLTRSEFLFYGHGGGPGGGDGGLPDEETQLAAYLRLLDWAGGRPVTVRTLDAGGDKPIPGLTPEGEENPFLGLRGLRLSLARPEVFRVQLRALARAAARAADRAADRGPLKVMVPMVTRPEELEQARRLFEAEVRALEDAGVEARLPPLGMMIEVPAAALNVAAFEADFFSIGSNDLVQYVTAASRDNAAVAALYDAADPAVMELIGRVAAFGAQSGREVSLCGDMAAEPAHLQALLRAGLRAVSVAPAALARTKAAVARISLAGDGADGG